MTVTFARTRFAAHADKGARWKLIEALQEDAESNDVPVKSAESFVAATEALTAAGNEVVKGTVNDLLITAEFDHESSARQRETWRRYGWTVIRQVGKAYNAGHWTRDEAFRFLDKAQPVSFRQVEGKIRDLSVARQDEKTLSEEWESWIAHVADLVAKGDELARRTLNEGGDLSVAAAMGPAIFDRLRERTGSDAIALDQELRELLAAAT